ncbi:hypothetical protein Ndes2526B_g06041 [Nannochloris sp. 'desiccata']|nr:putative M-phase phosphoprotein 8 [Chlorella desiccata (nom. nud.)]
MSISPRHSPSARSGRIAIQSANLELRNKHGATALMAAVVNGHETTVGLLLRKGADTEATNAFGMTALMLAAHHNRAIIANMLLAKVDAKNNDGETALMEACQCGNDDVVRALLGTRSVPNLQVVRHFCGALSPPMNEPR